MDQMSFMLPVPIGQLIILRSSVNRVFRASMEVGVKVWVENPQTGELSHTSSAYLTFVAIGEDGKPVAVPPVVAESEEEERRYHEAGRRRDYGWLHATVLSLQHQRPQQSWCPELVSFGCHAGR